MEERKIPFQNYIILGLIIVATCILLYYLVSHYEKRKEYKSSIDSRMGFLSEMKENEVQNYILDNHDAIIYVSDSTDDAYRAFEKGLKDLIVKENLTKEIVYLDLYKASSSFITNLQDEWFSNDLQMEEFSYPNLLIVSNGAISSVLYRKQQTKNPKEVIDYIKEHLDNE